MEKVIMPVHDRITVRKFPDEDKTKSGLYLPEKKVEGTYCGEVIHVGPGRFNAAGERTPMDIHVGDIVYFTRIAGVMHTIEGEDLVVMREEDCSVAVRRTNDQS